MASMATSRSGSGCWTCRLRKKKCDDVRPVCGPCEFRNITCHGFGLKPSFLCSAEDQKAEIAKIQKAVSDSFKARRAFRVAKKATRPSQPRPVVAAGSRDETADLTKAYEAQLSLQSGPSVSTKGPVAGNATVLPVSEPWLLSSSGPSVQAGLLQSSEEKHRESIRNEKEYPRTFLPNAYPAQNAQDLALVMNYLDRIFPLQYYFYQPTREERGRGWLLALLLRSKPSFYITLAFSSLQQIRYVYTDDVSKEKGLYEELDQYHSLGIIELQKHLEYLATTSGPEHLIGGVDALACTIQLCSIDVFRQTKLYLGWRGDWEIHVNAAGSLLSIIGTELSKSSESSTAPDTVDGKTPPESIDAPASLSSLNDYAGLDFFTTTYVWVDIIRCCSIGAGFSGQGPFPYLAYLEEDRIRLDKQMGVKNWAMMAIRQTADLEAWKIELRDRLDIPMLTRRAWDIENRLDRGLESIPKILARLPSSSTWDRESLLVTEIYALSALIYLSIVVSGNFHLTPKIRLGVTKVLGCINQLPVHLLIRVSWPCTVAGCMAIENEKNEFRHIVTDATEKGYHPGTLLNGLELMEDFWTMRESSDKNVQSKGRSKCPWAIAMER
ncbi:uncharacterized protein PAC_05900 [Phialocephala subalpina]|uniref:Zn(2)-C6 fungal-type domain-containing protein n=1 Tax=Phialocephala subalpina TaxID=576137 RepID=A0A1L7WTA5_9HELO|nr:uncharacterized protein PAC_05900 [Phialocephala subalpina]